MNDRSSGLLNYTELKFSKEQGFFDKSKGVRALIGLFFVLSLFSILHFREVRVDVLEFNSAAPGYVVAQIDFDFLDEEGMVILRQEAVRDIGKIYAISEKDVRQYRSEFETFLINHPEWRQHVTNANFDDMYHAINTLEMTLSEVRLTDPRTLHKMQELKIPANYYVMYGPLNASTKIIFPPHTWEVIKSFAFPKENTSADVIEYIDNFFKNKNWQLEEDFSAERALRRRVQGSIQNQYVHVNAGSRIIDQGEKITVRHIAMLQAMKQALSDQRNLWRPLTLLGTLFMTLVITGICVAYFRVNHPQVLYSNRKLLLLVTIVVLSFGLAKFIELFLLSSKTNLIELVRYPLVVPFSAILLCSLLNSNVATFTCGLLTIIFTMALSFERQGFMILNLAAALVAILSTRSLRRRKEVFVVCAKTWCCSVVIICSLHFYQNFNLDTALLMDIMSAAIFLLFTAILVVGLFPLLESAFRIMTDVTLMEFMDPNNDLLRRLTIEAPGSYQHSVVVGNLTESAAIAIGANGLFCRVAALYHDIGKIVAPQYFTENQQEGMNIHQLLTPEESAKVIISHVPEGVALARKAGLPEQFIDIIKEHHGTTLAYYFYRKQLDKVGGDKSLVDEREFRYAGPKPRSKESAIIMIADSVEAASRSLDKISEDALMQLATRLIKEKADDGQFDNCLLTFEELAIVRYTLVKTLLAYGHSRVKYPIHETPIPVDEGSIIDES